MGQFLLIEKMMAVKSFNSEWPNRRRREFSGAILDGIDQLVLDLEKIDTINSCGIRKWIKWIQSAPSQCKNRIQKLSKGDH